MKMFYSALAVMAVVGVGVLSTTQPANSQGIWSALKNSGLEAITPLSKFRIEVPGYDVRFYEFKSKANPEYSCVTGFSESGPVGLQCFPSK